MLSSTGARSSDETIGEYAARAWLGVEYASLRANMTATTAKSELRNFIFGSLSRQGKFLKPVHSLLELASVSQIAASAAMKKIV